MLVTLSGIVISVNAEQPLKAESPMLVIPLPKVTLARLVQPLKAPSPMLVTLLPIVTLASLVQSLKAEFPMLIILSGITISVNAEQP